MFETTNQVIICYIWCSLSLSLSRRCFLSLPLDSLRLLDCRGLLSLKVIISTVITKKNKTSTMILIIINKDNHTTHIPRISNVPNVTSIGNMFPPIKKKKN